MSAAQHLGSYAQGWIDGDAEVILEVTAEGYAFDDPNAGRIPKSGFAAYLDGLKALAAARRGGTLPEPFMALSEVVTEERDGVLTAWGWWSIAGADLQGSALIKVGPEGVRSEVVTYYTRLPAS